MIRITLALAFSLALASIANAQTVARQADLLSLNMGAITATPVDDDGDPSTEAWLIETKTPAGTFRLLVIRADGSLCLEDAFTPVRNLFQPTASIVRLGDRDVLRVVEQTFQPWTTIFGPAPEPESSMLTVFQLDRVRCR